MHLPRSGEVSVFVVPLDQTRTDIESCVFQKSVAHALDAPNSGQHTQFIGLTQHYLMFVYGLPSFLELTSTFVLPCFASQV